MPTNNITLVSALDRIRLGNLYVHNDVLPDANFTTGLLKTRKVYLVETLAVLNALVDRGTMLLYGGHGGGKTTLAKYLGQVFHRFSKDAIENCILRGHPQLTEEKIIGSLDIAQLTRAKELNAEKKVDVIWNDFVDSQWKIIDEINRLSPYAQNILLSLLAESSVKYHNESKRLGNFTLFATMNPKDDTNSNWEMSLPFKDRFALALPITMPDYDSLSTIGREKDKSSKQDVLASYLNDFELKIAQDEVRDLKYSLEAELFINVIVSLYRLCDRISKESNDALTVEKGLCHNCRYNVLDKVCNKIVHPLSVRVKEDLYRYGKALAWYLGDKEVEVKHIKTLAPFMIWHRSSLSKRFNEEVIGKRFELGISFLNKELESTKEIIAIISNEFKGLLRFLELFEDVKKGKLTQSEFSDFITKIKDDRNNFLITKKEITPTLEKSYMPVYEEIIKFNERIENAQNIDELRVIKNELSARYDIPNRQFLADLIERKIKSIGAAALPKSTFKIKGENFETLINKDCELLDRMIKLKFDGNFNPAFNKTESLSDLGEADFSLTMEKLSEGRGKFIFRFVYQGNEDNPILTFLKANNAGDV